MEPKWKLTLCLRRLAFRFGETVEGEVQINVPLDSDCRWLGLEWQWRTHGRGDRDAGPKIALKLFEGRWRGGQTYRYPFQFTAPHGPGTYHGTWLNVDWYLKAVADPHLADGPLSVEKEFLLTAPDVDSATDIRPPRKISALDFSGVKPPPCIEDEINPGVGRSVYALLLLLFGLFGLGFAPVLFRMQDHLLSREIYLGGLFFGLLMIPLALRVFLLVLADYKPVSPMTVVALLLGIGLELVGTALLASWFGAPAARLGGGAVAMAALYGVYIQTGYRRMAGLAIRIEPGAVRRGNAVEYLLSTPATLGGVVIKAEATLSCQEGVTEQVGTEWKSRMFTVFATQTPLVQSLAGTDGRLMFGGSIAVPQDAPVTFSGTNNQVIWRTKVRVVAKGLRVWDQSYPIAVRP